MNFKLTIITPTGVFLEREVRQIDILSETGWLGILPFHADLIASIKPCAMTYLTSYHLYTVACGLGIMNVRKNNVTIIVDGALAKEQINYEEVKLILENAKKRLALQLSKKEKLEIASTIESLSSQLKVAESSGRVRLNNVEKK